MVPIESTGSLFGEVIRAALWQYGLCIIIALLRRHQEGRAPFRNLLHVLIAWSPVITEHITQTLLPSLVEMLYLLVLRHAVGVLMPVRFYMLDSLSPHNRWGGREFRVRLTAAYCLDNVCASVRRAGKSRCG